MSNHEHTKAKLPFTELEFPLSRAALMTESEVAIKLINRLKRRGLHGPNLFYSGVDATLLRQSGTFGDRKTTYAVPEADYLEIVADQDKYGFSDGMYQNPYRYAVETLGKDAAVVVFNGDLFEPAEDGAQYNWQLLEDHTMDEAAVAVIYLQE
jgi:hypothetical protein